MCFYESLSNEELRDIKRELDNKYNDFKSKNISLDMSRGRPSEEQLNLSLEMLDCITSKDAFITKEAIDIRNYGIVDGIIEAKKLFGDMLGVSVDEIFIGGNSSLTLMYDAIAKAMEFGVLGSDRPWKANKKVKFLCPVPGYDRHFFITEAFGIEMIPIEMDEEGPDMDKIEELVENDESIKGIWCVPMYSNPVGITYSDDVVRRLANLKPLAKDFRIFWDNAYCVHHLTDTPDKLLNIMEECKKVHNEDRVYIFASTSKITFPGSGVAVMAASEANLQFLKKQISVQMIGYDKINQYRHVKYLKDQDGIRTHMKRHAEILGPKFDIVMEILDRELGELNVLDYKRPNGGYFISIDTMDGCAKRVYELCKDAGVLLTKAGSTFPYGKDPRDRNIRLAPSLPPVSELTLATNLLTLCVKIASVEKVISSRVGCRNLV
jgi:aspartate/methionine/tyrosine aminotransferase